MAILKCRRRQCLRNSLILSAVALAPTIYVLYLNTFYEIISTKSKLDELVLAKGETNVKPIKILVTFDRSTNNFKQTHAPAPIAYKNLSKNELSENKTVNNQKPSIASKVIVHNAERKESPSLSTNKLSQPAAEIPQKTVSAELMTLYLQKLEELPQAGGNHNKNNCTQKNLLLGNVCVDPNCTETLPPPPKRLRNIIEGQHIIEDNYLAVLQSLASQSQKADLVFLTAASSNHFHEVQPLIKQLFEQVFPILRRNYTTRLVYYDLGLKPKEFDILKKQCDCDVIKFPFDSFPSEFRRLHTCGWKPLLLKAHLHTSKVTFWMDASMRLHKHPDITPLLNRALKMGMVVSRTGWVLPMHVAAEALEYFRVSACSLSAFHEIAGGFVGMKNDKFIQSAILDPWVACTFSPSCICPGKICVNGINRCYRNDVRYSKCHRFDQSALGVILVTLFHYKSANFVLHARPFEFSRGDKIVYFKET